MKIETKRLSLEDYTVDDFQYFWLLKSSIKVWRYSTFIPYKNKEQAIDDFKKILDSLNGNPYQFAALRTKEDNRFIGEAGIISLNQQANRCVIGYNLLPDYWNMGFATEITKSLISYAFKNLGVERVEALALSSNLASRKVLHKSGFFLEGLLRHFAKINDEYFDVYYYSVISSDFYSPSFNKAVCD